LSSTESGLELSIPFTGEQRLSLMLANEAAARVEDDKRLDQHYPRLLFFLNLGSC
jgi:hypothetical protein